MLVLNSAGASTPLLQMHHAANFALTLLTPSSSNKRWSHIRVFISAASPRWRSCVRAWYAQPVCHPHV